MRLSKLRRRVWAAGALLAALGLALALLYSSPVRQAALGEQGCVNQGQDRRLAASVVCWAQQRLSWKSKELPHFLLIGNPAGTSLGLAWPPYLVFNTPAARGGWWMFRIGFRYDRSWPGYIFPTVAWKRVSRPLRY